MRCEKVMNKKGGVIVFLASILVAMIMMSMVFVHATREVCGASYSDAVLQLAGRSVLSEFDRVLKDEYGIFAFYGFEDAVADDIRFYASSSFNKTLPGEPLAGGGVITDLFRLKLMKTEVKLGDYSLIDADVFEKQIEGYMDYMIAQKGLEFIRGMWGKTPDETEKEAQSPERELKNGAEINSLPSRGNVSNGIDIDAIISGGVPSLEKIINAGTVNFKVNEYILSNFKYGVGGDKARDTFFRNEAEYVLYGNLKDKDNVARFRSDFVLLRVALNIAHIYSSPEKRSAVAALAEAFGPVAAPAADVAITAVWATVEAENDARLLLAGKNVALIKSDRNWAIDLKAAVRAKKIRDDDGEVIGADVTPKNVKGCISPESDDGLAYRDYLRIFLYLEKKETKLMRVMDLIQLNLRGSYYEDFLIKDHYAGFSLAAVVSGKKFEYEQKY